MILYNTTYTLDKAKQHEWLYWMQQEYLPLVREGGLVVATRLLKLLTDVGQEGAVFSVQLDFETLKDYEVFLEKYASDLQQRMHFRFGGQLPAFSTLLEQI
ncbi:hypothetical protein GCM10027578_20860 [Spirosoma luteolum]